MTVFSTLFSAHIKNKNIRTYPLAQYCGVDRSNMYKLINGKRNPSSESIVQKMADFMKLTPSERKELLEAYQITITGYESYYRRRNVEELIVDFCDDSSAFSDYEPNYLSTFNLPEDSENISLSGKSALEQTIYSIISMEGQNPNGSIKLLLQPDSGYFMEVLTYLGGHVSDLKVEHIICLNNTDNITSDKRDYNLTCLQKIIPIYCSCHYEYVPLYYYDSILSHTSAFNLLSSMILTSKYALLFSPVLQYGILFTQRQKREHFAEIFDTLKKETTPIVCKIDSLYTQLAFFNNLAFEHNKGYSFQKLPCLMPLLPLSFPEKYLTKELLDEPGFIDSINQYVRRTADIFKTSATQFFFTEDGIRSFLETGRIFEISDSVYRPIEYSDRLLMMRNLISACKTDKYRMLRPDAPITSSNLCLYVTAHQGYLLFASADKNLVYLNLEEPSLLYAFYDYLESLDDTFYYSTEETTAILQKMIKANLPSKSL